MQAVFSGFWSGSTMFANSHKPLVYGRLISVLAVMQGCSHHFPLALCSAELLFIIIVVITSSRKHAYIILTPLNPTFI